MWKPLYCVNESMLSYTPDRHILHLKYTMSSFNRVHPVVVLILKITWFYYVKTQQQHTILSTLVWLLVSVFSRTSSDQYFPVEGAISVHTRYSTTHMHEHVASLICVQINHHYGVITTTRQQTLIHHIPTRIVYISHLISNSC
jgi:hypothetical protein